jgi:hypothetical protein
MRRERQIIELYSRRKSMISKSVFFSYLRGVQERCVANKVCDKAKYIDCWEIDRCSCRGAPTEVQDGLRVEGEGPAKEVDPPKRGGNEMQKGGRSCHVGSSYIRSFVSGDVLEAAVSLSNKTRT